MKNVFLKISLLLFLFVSCNKQNAIFLSPVKYRLPCSIVLQEIIVNTKDAGTEKETRAKLWYKKNRVRIEVTENNLKNVIIMDDKYLYIFDEKSKTGYQCDRFSDYAINFLSHVIINSGLGYEKEIFAGQVEENKQKYFVYAYYLFVPYNNIYTRTYVEEFRKTNDEVVKIKMKISPYFKNEKVIIKEMKIISSKCKIFLSDNLFKIDKNINLIKLQKTH
jgi:outer membrane lipoprotein-sorting protein